MIINNVILTNWIHKSIDFQSDLGAAMSKLNLSKIVYITDLLM